MNSASALGDNVMEMKSQDSNVNYSAAEFETRFRSPHKANSNIVAWGQLSSQNLHPPTLCFATPLALDPVTGTEFDEEDEAQQPREMIERRFEAQAVEKPEELRPTPLEKLSTVVDKPDE